MIKYNKNIVHIDLSYTNLDQEFITAIGNAMRRAKSLVAIHFTGNPGVNSSIIKFL